jgi:hypothetical protein
VGPGSCLVLAALCLAAAVVEAKVKVKVQRDEAFAFKGLRTWAWHTSGPGEVRMAVSADDKPEAVRERVEPVLMDAVAKEMPTRGLTAAAAGQTPDVYVHYYVLINTNMSAQTMGQFVPSVPEWGLPPFSGATQSLRVFEQGSLLIDITAASTSNIVWRGVAQAELHRERALAQREANLRSAIAELLKKFPKTT